MSEASVPRESRSIVYKFVAIVGTGNQNADPSDPASRWCRFWGEPEAEPILETRQWTQPSARGLVPRVLAISHS